MSICTGLVIRTGDVGPDGIETRHGAGLVELVEVKATLLPFAPPSLVHQVRPVLVPLFVPLGVFFELDTYRHHSQRVQSIGGVA